MKPLHRITTSKLKMNKLEEFFYGSYTNIRYTCIVPGRNCIITINPIVKWIFWKYNTSLHQQTLNGSLWTKIELGHKGLDLQYVLILTTSPGTELCNQQ